jgi:hypothetical protein
MGAACCDLPGMAAQSRHLARQVRGDPAGIRPDGGGDRRVRAAALAGRRREHGQCGARDDPRGGEPRRAPGSSRLQCGCDQRLVDSGLRTDLRQSRRAWRRSRAGRTGFQLQLMGRKVRRLRSRRRGAAPVRRAMGFRGDRTRYGARGRVDRRRRRGHPAHDRIVPAQPQSQPRPGPRRDRTAA